MPLHQTVAVPGGYEFLKTLEASPASALIEDEIVGLMTQAGIEEPAYTLRDFLAGGLLARYGARVGISALGIRTTLLVEALNGGDMRDVFRRLSYLDSTLRMYELIREGMTRQFLQSLNERPGFARLYFCSPWISLDRSQRSMLNHAIHQVEKRGVVPEIYLITRPSGQEDSPPDNVRPFRDLGASIYLNRRLHTKLYVREPDRSGGYSMAIVGSQNLTRSQYLELGIRINADTVMVDQLISYFWDICNASLEA